MKRTYQTKHLAFISLAKNILKRKEEEEEESRTLQIPSIEKKFAEFYHYRLKKNKRKQPILKEIMFIIID